MKTKVFIKIAWHLLYWIVFFGFLALFTGAEQFSVHFITVDIPIAVVYTYLIAYFLVPYFLKRRRIALLLALIAAISLLLSFVRLVNYDYIYYSLLAPGRMESDFTLSFPLVLLNAKDFSFSLMIFLAVRYTRAWIVSNNREIENQTDKLESELKLLKAQVDPHFLFNTLNNLYSLTVSEPERSGTVIRKIWGIMDFLANEANYKMIRMDKEIQLIKDYTDLELLRYDGRLEFTFQVEGDFSLYKSPPLIFFPLVENCFKHGSAPAAGESMIMVSFSELADRIRFETRNSLPETNRVKDVNEILKGNSIRHIRNRLNIHMPVKHKIKADITGSILHILIEIYF